MENGLRPIKDLGGTTGATLTVTKTGKQIVVKRGATSGHIANEYEANQVYKALGVPVPECELQIVHGRCTLLSEYIDGIPLNSYEALNWTSAMSDKDEIIKQIRGRFAIIALLGDWDAIGMVGDNIIVRDGVAYQIDSGGALKYRAQGGLKVTFNSTVSELHTLRDPKRSVYRYFGRITDDEVRSQIKKIKLKDIPDVSCVDLLKSRLRNLKKF